MQQIFLIQMRKTIITSKLIRWPRLGVLCENLVFLCCLISKYVCVEEKSSYIQVTINCLCLWPNQSTYKFGLPPLCWDSARVGGEAEGSWIWQSSRRQKDRAPWCSGRSSSWSAITSVMVLVVVGSEIFGRKRGRWQPSRLSFRIFLQRDELLLGWGIGWRWSKKTPGDSRRVVVVIDVCP